MGRHPALTETQAREAAHLALNGVAPRELAERFSISERTLARIVARERARIRELGRDGMLERLEFERR